MKPHGTYEENVAWVKAQGWLLDASRFGGVWFKRTQDAAPELLTQGVIFRQNWKKRLHRLYLRVIS